MTDETTKEIEMEFINKALWQIMRHCEMSVGAFNSLRNLKYEIDQNLKLAQTSAIETGAGDVMKNCKTCKWWITPAEAHPHLLNDPHWQNWGECELLGRNGEGNPRAAPNSDRYGEWHAARLAETYGTGASSDSGLNTHSNFGCVQHEEI